MKKSAFKKLKVTIVSDVFPLFIYLFFVLDHCAFDDDIWGYILLNYQGTVLALIS